MTPSIALCLWVPFIFFRFIFSASLLFLCFSAFFAFLLFLLVCFSVFFLLFFFSAFLLLCFSSFLLLLLVCFSASLLVCFFASLLFCFSASPLSDFVFFLLGDLIGDAVATRHATSSRIRTNLTDKKSGVIGTRGGQDGAKMRGHCLVMAQTIPR